MGGRENRGDDGVERTGGGVIQRGPERRAREPRDDGSRDQSTLERHHEQPELERHELPGTVPVWAYHEYHHGGRWAPAETPLREHSLDWLASGEWLVYDVDVRESGAHDLFLRVAAAEGFGDSQLGIVVDDDPRNRLRFDATGGWDEWTELQTTVALSRGLHTIRLVVFDGGWKLGGLRFR